MAKRVALALCLMGSTPNLSHIAAYGAMAELVEAYFNTAGQAPLDLADVELMSSEFSRCGVPMAFVESC